MSDDVRASRLGRLATTTGSALSKAKGDGSALVSRVGESYRAWSSDSPIEPVGPGDLLPASSSADAAALDALHAADPIGAGTSEFSVPGLAIDPDAIVLAELLIAASITVQNEHGNEDRHTRMERYVWNRQLALQDAIGVPERIGVEAVLRQLTDGWSLEQRLLLLIETAARNPFAPYEIAWDPNQELAGLAHLATVLDLAPSRAGDVASAFTDAAKAHSGISMTKVGLYGMGAAAMLGGAGFLAAPILGAAIGGAMGLTGAAATSGGLGVLGGMAGAGTGSLMSGGMWLVAQVGAATGALAGAGGSLLYEMGAAQAQNEIIKLQVTYKLILVDLQRNDALALEVLGLLDDRVAELEAALDNERDFSEPGSSRITDMEATLGSLVGATEWMDEQLDLEDDGGVLVNVRSLDWRIERLERRVSGNSAASVVYDSDATQLRDLLSPAELARIDDRVDCRFAIRSELDRWDVIAAAAFGITAATLDHFLASNPSGGITKWLRDNHAIRGDKPPWLKTLERIAGVPYDQSIGDGITPNNHRSKTLGHDPLIGLILGTRDIMNGAMTTGAGVSVGVGGELVNFVDNPNFDGLDHLFSALLTQVAHLISDVVTPAGLPLPGWSVLTTITPGIADTAVDMYTKGYDTWHLAPMTIPVASIHTTSAAWWAMREASGEPVSSDRKDALTLLATGIAATGDLASMLAVGGNPLALNYVTWIDLVRRIAKQANRRSYRSALVTLDDAARNQHLLNHGWTALLG